MYKFLVAFRYLRRNWLSLVGIAAVAIGVIVLICVLSVMKGFDEEFRSRIRATLSDLIIEGWSDEPFSGYAELIRKIERLPHVVACAPQYEGLALMRLRGQSRYAEFHGVDLEREVRATDFAHYWRAWRAKAARDELASRVDADPHLALLTPETAADLLTRLRREEYALLPSSTRAALAAWARARRYDLGAAFEAAEKAVPVWPASEEAKESPAFTGSELLVIGRDTAGQPVSLSVGDSLVLITASDIFESRVIRRCRVAGAFKSGLYEYDLRNIYLPLADVQKFMDKAGHVTSISVRLDSFDNAPQVRAALLGILTSDEIARGLAVIRPVLKRTARERLRDIESMLAELRRGQAGWFAEGNPRVIALTLELERALYSAIGQALREYDEIQSDRKRLEDVLAFQKLTMDREQQSIGRQFRISTWEDKRRTFLRAVWLERRIMAFILFFVILIAGFLILAILHTSVLHKTKDIGILKAIGGTVGGIMTIFLLNGLFIGVIGCAVGTAGGLLITRNINRIEEFLAGLTGFRLFPPDIYYLDRVPVDKDPFWSTVAISVTAVIVSLLASAYPAWKASRMDPVETLRYE